MDFYDFLDAIAKLFNRKNKFDFTLVELSKLKDIFTEIDLNAYYAHIDEVIQSK